MVGLYGGRVAVEILLRGLDLVFITLLVGCRLVDDSVVVAFYGVLFAG